MARRLQYSLGLTFTVITILWAGAEAQSNDCTNVLISMSPCLDYISGNSSSGPSSGCCTQLRTVVGSRPQCLCQLLNSNSNLGLNINQTQALALPAACSVPTPPTTQCRNAATPSGSPVSRPNSPNTNSGAGSENVPDGSSGANSTKLGVSLLFSLFLVASYVSTLAMA
ncbi:Bifunctional inhibitor/lipid-transfer protein/seed storage 2S albumin superfamily protein [Striga hermonthica]|uniref:Bifunctional inhibitor/lipid-transfer protein/seed storage 2S albumin superfamily protein n=1 Tax=Striga hermonthica TaxID=68872 RepID=A0A9N7MKS0_STRHE|nr:Bifunctional inhibitor/lipid-transfer protein/seed storage 2S albumin superfamily protein [Striga hermonthica]